MEYDEAMSLLRGLTDAGVPVSFGGNAFLDIPWVWEGDPDDNGWRWRLKLEPLREGHMDAFERVLAGRGLRWVRLGGGSGEYASVYRPGYRAEGR